MKEMSFKQLKNSLIDLYSNSDYDDILIKHIEKTDAKRNIQREITKELIEKQRQSDISSVFALINDMKKVMANNYTISEKNKVYQAIYYAAKMHLDHSHRESGGPYVTHPIYVAYIIAGMNLDIETIIAALYHDIVEDEDYTGEDIRKISNGVIENLVLGLSKLDTNNNKPGRKDELDKVERDSLYLQSLFKYMRIDIRIIFVKLADRLHNMETLYAKKPVSQKRISRQTMYVFAPVAKKLGMYKIANRLEDLAFKYLYPKEYEKMSQIRTDLGNDDDALNELVLKIRSLINYKYSFTIRTRIKHVYGIFKHSLDEEDLNSIPDLRAIKIIIDDSGSREEDLENCREILNIIKSSLDRYSNIIDYTTKAKIDGYQAIIIEIDNLEIQIMTRSMYNISRWGIAGYYKNINNKKEALKQIKSFISDNKSIIDLYEEIGQDNFIIRSKIIGKGNIFIINEDGNEIAIKESTNISDYFKNKSIDFKKHMVYINNMMITNPNYILKMNDKINLDKI